MVLQQEEFFPIISHEYGGANRAIFISHFPLQLFLLKLRLKTKQKP